MSPKWTFAVAATLLMCAAAHAEDGPKAGLAKCAALTDDHERLACFDQLASVVKSLPDEPAPSAAPAPDGGSMWDTGGWFGHSHRGQTTVAQFGVDAIPAAPPPPSAGPQDAPLDSITAKVVQFAYHGDGTFEASLDNGQVWEQVQRGSDQARFAGNDEVTIWRGFMGSYNFSISGSNTMFKVRRIK